MQMLHLKLLSVECMSQPNNQNETDTRLLAGQIFGDGALTRAPCGPFLQAHPRVSLAHFKGGSARKHGHGENKGAKGTEDWADQSNKAAASTVFSTISHQHQITPSKHTHGTTFLVLKSLGPILCNNPPFKTSKFPTFLGEPFCSPVSPPSFIFPPVPAPPLNNGIDIFVMLDFSFFRNFVFSGCPVWPRFKFYGLMGFFWPIWRVFGRTPEGRVDWWTVKVGGFDVWTARNLPHPIAKLR